MTNEYDSGLFDIIRQLAASVIKLEDKVEELEKKVADLEEKELDRRVYEEE